MRNLDRTLDTLKSMAPTTPPPDTCPLIDSVITRLEAVRHDLGELRLQALNSTEPMDSIELGNDLWNATDAMSRLPETMEEIRHHNARLRNLSLYWYRMAKKLHEEGRSNVA